MTGAHERAAPRTVTTPEAPNRFPQDAVQAALVRGAWQTPKAGDTLTAPGGGDGSLRAWAGERLPYFVSGVVYPDWLVANSTVLTRGVEGLIGSGFFGNDWKIESGDAAWRRE